MKSAYVASALDGEGARLAGGCWNLPGIPLTYCASSLSLAVLELLVQLETVDLPDDLIAIQVSIPEAITTQAWLTRVLPADWRREAGKPALQARGDAWLKGRVTCVLQVPSVIVPTESNFLLNPGQSDFARIKVAGREPFVLDRGLL